MRLMFKPIPTLAYLCLLPVLISLGGWQLNRANEKRDFFNKQTQGMQSEIIPLLPDTPVDIELLRYHRVSMVGHYDAEHQFLLDNQVSERVVGYFVMAPFILKGSAQAVLVNRGWIPLKDRNQLPDVSVPIMDVQIQGRLNHFPSVGIKLAGAEVPTKTWPSVVGLVDTAVLSKVLGYSLMSFQVELDQNQVHGYKRDWHETTVMRPEQHIAYAAQWFGLALLLSFLFFRYSFKRD